MVLSMSPNVDMRANVLLSRSGERLLAAMPQTERFLITRFTGAEPVSVLADEHSLPARTELEHFKLRHCTF